MVISAATAPFFSIVKCPRCGSKMLYLNYDDDIECSICGFITDCHPYPELALTFAPTSIDRPRKQSRPPRFWEISNPRQKRKRGRPKSFER